MHVCKTMITHSSKLYIVYITCKNPNLNQNDKKQINVGNIKVKGQTFAKTCIEKINLNNNSAYITHVADALRQTYIFIEPIC